MPDKKRIPEKVESSDQEISGTGEIFGKIIGDKAYVSRFPNCALTVILERGYNFIVTAEMFEGQRLSYVVPGYTG